MDTQPGANPEFGYGSGDEPDADFAAGGGNGHDGVGESSAAEDCGE